MGPETPVLSRVLVSVWRMISLESKAGLRLILGQTLRQTRLKLHQYLQCCNFQEWTDNNLRWNETEYGNVKDLRFPPSTIWTPDILMYNRYNNRVGIL